MSSISREVQQEIMERHNIAVEMINPNLAKWNEEFDRLYPDKDGRSEEYSSFMSKKFENIIKIANGYDIGHNLVTLVISPNLEITYAKRRKTSGRYPWGK